MLLQGAGRWGGVGWERVANKGEGAPRASVAIGRPTPTVEAEEDPTLYLII